MTVGDKIKVWYKPGYDIITALRPHPKFDEMFNTKGGQIASFALGTGMTIEPDMCYDVYEKEDANL